MTPPRESWTDERLDDLKADMHREFGQVHREFDRVHAEIGALHARFDALNRTLLLVAGSIVASVLGAALLQAL